MINSVPASIVFMATATQQQVGSIGNSKGGNGRRKDGNRGRKRGKRWKMLSASGGAWLFVVTMLVRRLE